MEAWKSFEKECCEYLNRMYGNDKVCFVWDGGSDSTSPDIMVFINGRNEFNIEVKSPHAQSGQFVVLNENGRLIFSPRNKSDIEDAIPFLSYMNANYSRYAVATTSGTDLDMDSDEYNEWIIGHYQKRRVKFVITRDTFSFVIFPIEKYGEYFQTSCVYRIKKSGSTEVPRGIAEDVTRLFGGVSYRYEFGKKLCVVSNRRHFKGTRLTYGDYDYLVSSVLSDGALYIRRLSNTYNANVIFTISLKAGQIENDHKEFVRYINRGN